FPDLVGDRPIYAAPIVAAVNDPYLRLDREVRVGEVARLARAFTFENLVAPPGVVEVVRAPDGPQHMIQYDNKSSPVTLIATVALLAFVVGLAWTARLATVAAEPRAQFALAIVIYNITFHFFYRANGQPFIFTMHTVFPLILLIAFVYESSQWRRRSAALATVAALLVWNSAVFVHFVDQALAKE